MNLQQLRLFPHERAVSLKELRLIGRKREIGTLWRRQILSVSEAGAYYVNDSAPMQVMSTTTS